MRTRLIVALVALLGIQTACRQDAAVDATAGWVSPVSFDSTWVQISNGPDTFRVAVEVAATPEQRNFGLMDRPTLPADRGMIFLYPEVQDSANGFWMFRTRVPLDIAFVDSAGQIASIRSMEPCDSPNPEFCPTYAPGVRFQNALEVNRGFFDDRGIGVGWYLAVDSVQQAPVP